MVYRRQIDCTNDVLNAVETGWPPQVPLSGNHLVMHPSLRLLSARAHTPLIRFLGKRSWPSGN